MTKDPQVEVEERMQDVVDACRGLADCLTKWRGEAVRVSPEVAFYTGCLMGVLCADGRWPKEKGGKGA